MAMAATAAKDQRREEYSGLESIPFVFGQFCPSKFAQVTAPYLDGTHFLYNLFKNESYSPS